MEEDSNMEIEEAEDKAFEEMKPIYRLEFIFNVKTDVSPVTEWCIFVQKSQVLVLQTGRNSESE